MNKTTLYERLGGYDATLELPTICCHAYKRMQLARFWQHRGEDGVKREKQLLIDFCVRVQAVPCTTPDET
jgi:hemoglobin